MQEFWKIIPPFTHLFTIEFQNQILKEPGFWHIRELIWLILKQNSRNNSTTYTHFSKINSYGWCRNSGNFKPPFSNTIIMDLIRSKSNSFFENSCTNHAIEKIDFSMKTWRKSIFQNPVSNGKHKRFGFRKINYFPRFPFRSKK